MKILFPSNNQKLKNNKNNVNNPSVSTYDNHDCVVFGARNVGKTYYVLRLLKKGNKRPIHIITRSPDQYPNYKTSNEKKPTDRYKRSVVIFDDKLGARNCSQIDEFFTRVRHENLDVFYISQNYFGLTRQSIRNKSDRLILFRQTSRDVQSMYDDIGIYDVKYDEFKELVRKAWGGNFNYLCSHMSQNKNGVNVVFSMTVKTLILNVFAKLKFLKII